MLVEQCKELVLNIIIIVINPRHPYYKRYGRPGKRYHIFQNAHILSPNFLNFMRSTLVNQSKVHKTIRNVRSPRKASGNEVLTDRWGDVWTIKGVRCD